MSQNVKVRQPTGDFRASHYLAADQPPAFTSGQWPPRSTTSVTPFPTPRHATQPHPTPHSPFNPLSSPANMAPYQSARLLPVLCSAATAMLLLAAPGARCAVPDSTVVVQARTAAPTLNVTLSFYNDERRMVVQAVLVSADARWVGVGASKTGSMIGGTAHTCNLDAGDGVTTYTLQQKSMPVGPSSPGGTGSSCIAAAGTKTLTFNVVDPTDEEVAAWRNVIWAIGSADQTFAYHAFRGTVAVQLPAGFPKNASTTGGPESAAVRPIAAATATTVGLLVAGACLLL